MEAGNVTKSNYCVKYEYARKDISYNYDIYLNFIYKFNRSIEKETYNDIIQII